MHRDFGVVKKIKRGSRKGLVSCYSLFFDSPVFLGLSSAPSIVKLPGELAGHVSVKRVRQ
jgi:hypothetical protein